MQHLDSIMRKADYFLSNNLISLNKEASNESKEYYDIGRNKISVWIDEHGRFNCNECGGYKKDALCSHVLASLIFRKEGLKCVMPKTECVNYSNG